MEQLFDVQESQLLRSVKGIQQDRDLAERKRSLKVVSRNIARKDSLLQGRLGMYSWDTVRSMPRAPHRQASIFQPIVV